MNNEKKVFAFKLAEKNESKPKWQSRDGVSIAGCSDPKGIGNFRAPRFGFPDSGIWC